MTRSLSLGLIGGGNFARATLLPAISDISGLSLRAVATASGESAASIARQYDCAYCTTEYSELLADGDIDLIVIATRHNLHADLATEALEAEKDVHLEKPVALTEEGLREVVEAERDSSGRLMVGFNRRFSPDAREIARNLQHRSTPLMIHHRVNVDSDPDHWLRDPDIGGGMLLGEVCHFVDLHQYFADAPPERVYASRVPPRDGQLPDVNVQVTVDYADGSSGHILYTSLGDNSVAKERVEVFGNSSVSTIDNFKTDVLGIDQDKGHENEFKAFRDAIVRDQPAPIRMDELIYTTLATFAIVQSIQERVPVSVSLPEYAADADTTSSIDT